MFSVKFSSKYNSANGKNSLFRIIELYVNNGIIHVHLYNVTGYRRMIWYCSQVSDR